MAWTTPRTWTVGEVATAAIMNTHLRDNLNHLFGAMLYDNILSGTGGWDTGSGGFSGAYSHLIGHISTKQSGHGSWADDWAYLRFNNDSGTNYYTQMIDANGTTVVGNTWKGKAEILLGKYGITPDVTNAGSIWFIIPDYARSSNDKAVLSRWGHKHGNSANEQGVGSAFGHWNSTAAITRIQINGAFTLAPGSGSRFTLYGLV